MDGKDDKTIELPPLGVYRLNMQDLCTCHVFPWKIPDEYWFQQAKFVENICGLNVVAGQTIAPEWLQEEHNTNRVRNTIDLIRLKKNAKHS